MMMALVFENEVILRRISFARILLYIGPWQ
jgi:hypothetical protein